MLTKLISVSLLVVALLLQACSFEQSGDAKVTLRIPKRNPTLAKSAATSGREWYRVVVRGPGMEEIVLSGEAGGSLKLDVPPGDARVFAAELFADAALTQKTYAGQAAPVRLEAGKPAVVVVVVRRVADNKPPTLAAAKIREGVYYSDSVIEVVPEGFNDPDGDAPVYRYEWLVNGAPVAGQAAATLAGDFFARGEKVSVRVTPGDGIAEGAPVLSNEVAIINAPPKVVSAAWAATLRAGVNAKPVPVLYDADADTVTYRMTWLVDGIPAQVEAGMDYLPSSWFSRGQIVEASIIPSDPYEDGPVFKLSAQVENSKPTAPEIELSQVMQGPGMLYVNLLSGASDPDFEDNETLTVVYIWYLNGLEFTRTESPFLESTFVGGDVWQVAAIASDGIDESVPSFSGTTTIGQTVAGVSLGMRAGCAITTGNNLACWGTGYLGDGPFSELGLVRNIPAFAGAASSVSVGANHICAIKLSGELKCWGQDNSEGQLGVGDKLPRATPATVRLVAGETGYKLVAAGAKHTCAVTTQNKTYCWGNAVYGQLGYGNSYGYSEPTAPAIWSFEPRAEVLSIAVGLYHSCASTADIMNPVYCWGSNSDGQIGISKTPFNNYSLSPVSPVNAPTTNGQAYVTAGEYHTCGLFSGNRVYCWGRNEYGQLGDGTRVSPEFLVMANLPTDATISSIAAGNESTCAIVAGSVYCWGRNRNGTLGDGTANDSASPIEAYLNPWGGMPVGLAKGGWAGCLVTDTDGINCWGYNQFGVLADGRGLNSFAPVHVSSMVMNPTSMDAGDRHICAISFSDVWCWGVAGMGQMGMLPPMPWEVFEPVMAGVPVTDVSEVAVKVSAGGDHTCVLRQNGAVACMGDNSNGQIGNGLSGTQENVAVPVIGLPVTATALAAGDDFSCALLQPGDVMCWGANDYGQLGMGEAGSSMPTPVTVVGAIEFSQISAGENHACGIDVAGALYCWGANTKGQIGDGSYSDAYSPVMVWSGNALSVSAGSDFTCAVTTNWEAYCWGSNAWGKLGTGTGNGDVPTPSPVASFYQVAKVAAGQNHACMLTKGGDVHCWGMNTALQLGTKTKDMSNVPDEAVALQGGAIEITVGAEFSCAVDGYGYAQCWGSNAFGQLTGGHRNPEPIDGLFDGMAPQ